MQRDKALALLSHKKAGKRLKGIKHLKKAEAKDGTLVPEKREDLGLVSVHSNYSFSPFTPSLAAYMAYNNGLNAVCISDHDTLSAVAEFKRACEMLGIECCTGLQLRARFYSGKGRVLNNIYEKDVGFVSVRGIPESSVESFNKELSAIRKNRLSRDKIMVDRFNGRLKRYGISISLEKDILPFSQIKEGGTVTERHILYAFATKLMAKFPAAEDVLKFLKEDLKIHIDGDYEMALADMKNPYYAYDLVDCLKQEISFFYLPDDTLPEVSEVVKTVHKYGGLVNYAYVGNRRKIIEGVEETILAEDEYLDELVGDLAAWEFDGLEYFTDFVSGDKADRLKALAAENGLIILGCTDIHSPRQHFNAPKVEEDLVRNKWAIVGHEKCVQYDLEDGINTEKSKAKNPELSVRLEMYSGAGRVKEAE